MRDTTFIYALNDPETGECRYVGKADDPHDRLFGDSGHLYDSKNKTHHCANWIRSLVTRGLRPLLEILQEVPKTEWELWERAWIKASRKIGMDLTNCTDGGEGLSSGYKFSPETCVKRSAAVVGEKNPMFGKKHSPETRAKISIAISGKPGTKGMLGKKHSEETRAKMRAGHLGKKHSPEHVEKSAATRRGKKLSPEICAKSRRKYSGSSNFYGVNWHGATEKWASRICVKNKRFHLGTFSSEIEAAEVYDTAAKIHHGVHAVLNFPD